MRFLVADVCISNNLLRFLGLHLQLEVSPTENLKDYDPDTGQQLVLMLLHCPGPFFQAIFKEWLAPFGRTRSGRGTNISIQHGGRSQYRMLSLIGTAKLNGINEKAYLRNLFTRIADHPSNRIDELLPWNITAEFAENSPADA